MVSGARKLSGSPTFQSPDVCCRRSWSKGLSQKSFDFGAFLVKKDLYQ